LGPSTTTAKPTRPSQTHGCPSHSFWGGLAERREGKKGKGGGGKPGGNGGGHPPTSILGGGGPPSGDLKGGFTTNGDIRLVGGRYGGGTEGRTHPLRSGIRSPPVQKGGNEPPMGERSSNLRRGLPNPIKQAESNHIGGRGEPRAHSQRGGVNEYSWVDLGPPTPYGNQSTRMRNTLCPPAPGISLAGWTINGAWDAIGGLLLISTEAGFALSFKPSPKAKIGESSGPWLLGPTNLFP